MASQAMNPNSMNLNTVKPPTGVNYKKWKQDLETTLGVMDMDLALRTEEPPGPTDDSTSTFIDATNAKDFLKSIEQKYKESPETETDATNTKDFLKFIKQKYKESPKTTTGNLMNSLTTMSYDGIESKREYILRMMDVAGKLKALDVPISEIFIVHVIKNSLPDSYSQLKVSYNALRDKWDANELIAICEQSTQIFKC
ncbi:unnamed protein product [Malus baccata var. baccata]